VEQASWLLWCFYPLLLQLRKAGRILVRMRVSHGARPAAACSASLRCHRSRDTDRTLLDDMEVVFDLFRAKIRLRVFLIRELTRGTPGATECARPANSFSRLCHAEFLSAQSVRFWTVSSGSRRAGK
jgi:hypothetical protein